MTRPFIEHECFIKVAVDGREEPCGRPREKLTDLCCLDHWRIVPKRLRQPLIEANKARSYVERERLSINAATAVVEYLKAQKIQLPPVPKLEVGSGLVTPGAEDMRIGALVKAEPGPQVVKNPKLIIP